ncbi:MAG: AAA family ATPase [Vicinamibacterales bacterium]
MTDDLTARILQRLTDTGHDSVPFALVVLAALESDDALERYLGGGTVTKPAVEPAQVSGAVEPPGIYLKSITVEGFRGVAGEATLALTPGPGLTLVVGRNGSGKSSFAEALELLLTGDNLRWHKRHKAWTDGWRNLHYTGRTRVAAELVVEGAGVETAERVWAADDDLGTGAASVKAKGQPPRPLSERGWAEKTGRYRPFLSYNELGAMLEEGPSKLYDALSPILGLDDMLEVQKRISDARKTLQDQVEAAKVGAEQLRSLATDLPHDPRAAGVVAALGKKTWDLDALQALAAPDEAGADDELAGLRALSLLQGPSLPDVEQATFAVRDAQAQAARVANTDAARSRARASLLESALGLVADAASDCPVCGTPAVLSSEWRAACAEEIITLKDEARSFDSAQDALRSAMMGARRLIQAPPPALADPHVDLPDLADARDAWHRWQELSDDDQFGRLAREFEERALACADASDKLRAAAATSLAARENQWRPIATALDAWLPKAKAATSAAEQLPDVKKAEKWWKDALETERDERFRPVAEQALATWRQLRLQSNVDLAAVELEGGAQRRRVELKVTVDGTPASAVGVMSQGELHGLALSLFLPRAGLPESPFRFICIDDPVQSMDPSRVDGLAKALAESARTRQVVVFTHDERLPESTRRLGIRAQVIEVTRRAASQVEVRIAQDPVAAALDDARALVKTQHLPPRIASRLVPGFCRVALEASGMAIVRRRRLGRGEPHQAVEDLLCDQRKLYPLFALALFDDAERTADVLAKLSKISNGGADAFTACNAGAHQEFTGDLDDLVHTTTRLTERLAHLA